MGIQQQWMRSAVIGCFENEGFKAVIESSPITNGTVRVGNPKNKKRLSFDIPDFEEDWPAFWRDAIQTAKTILADRVGRNASTGAFYQKRGPQRMRPV